MPGRPNSRSDFLDCCTRTILGSTRAGYHLTQVLLRTPAQGVSYKRRLHPRRVVVCVWSVVACSEQLCSISGCCWMVARQVL
jgi:hypothetical protein